MQKTYQFLKLSKNLAILEAKEQKFFVTELIFIVNWTICTVILKAPKKGAEKFMRYLKVPAFK